MKSETPETPLRPGRTWALPGLVLLAGLALSAWIFLTLERDRRRRETEFLSERIAEAQAVIRARLTTLADGLRGGVSFFAAMPDLRREQWRAFVESLRLDQRGLGVNGLGVIYVVPPADVGAWTERVRADGLGQPEIRPFPGTQPRPGEPHYLITYSEPLARNPVAAGRDIATEPSRRAAAEEARDTGEPRFHHRLDGSSDLRRRSGLLLYAPLYRPGTPTHSVAARRQAHFGWVYAQVYPDVLLADVLGPMAQTLMLHCFDGSSLAPGRLLYASGPAGAPLPERFEQITELQFAGQRFQLGWQRGPKFPRTRSPEGIWAAGGCALAAVLLAALVFNLQATGRRANALTAERTAALRKQQQFTAEVFRTMGEGLVVHAADGAIVDCNPAAERILGLSRDQIMGRSSVDPRWRNVRTDGTAFPHEEYPSAVTLRTGRACRGVQLGTVRPDGTTRWLEVTSEPLVPVGGGPPLAVVSFADITERRQLLSSLEQARDEALAASRLKSEFLANMSHEIRTPMNAVVGMAGLLADSPLAPEQAEMVRAIQGGADSLLAIIGDILDFSKIEAGKLAVDHADFDFRAVIEETVVLLTPRARTKGLQLVRDIDPALPPAVAGDGGRVRQVFTNLLANAIKFTDRGTVAVTVRATPAADGRTAVRVAVRDTGIGIGPEAQARLFQPFMQEDGSVTRRFGGTGLGLAISRHLVELMGGTIGFESEQGTGSTFWFELTFAAGQRRDPAPRTATRAAGDPRRTILLVEDNPANQAVALMLLGSLGHDVQLATDGKEALERLAARRYDVVLMDCQMPGLDGYETTRRIRAGRLPGVDPHVPIVALTAYAMADDRAKSLAAGMDEHLTKPIRADELRAVLERCAGGRPAAAPAAAPASEAETSVLDPRAFATARALPGPQGGSLLPELLALYREVETPQLEAIAASVRARAADAAATAAHALAGNAASFGAAEMRAELLALERLARAQDWPAAEAQLARVHQAAARLQAALARVMEPAG